MYKKCGVLTISHNSVLKEMYPHFRGCSYLNYIYILSIVFCIHSSCVILVDGFAGR